MAGKPLDTLLMPMVRGKQRDATKDAANRLGLSIEVSTPRRFEASGYVLGMQVRLAVWPPGGWQSDDPGRSVSIRPPNVPPDLGLSRWSVLTGWLRWLRQRPGSTRMVADWLDRRDNLIRLDDEAWDDAFAVSATDRESAVEYLTPERRAKILEVRDRDDMWRSVESGGVVLPWPEPVSADAVVETVTSSIGFVREVFGP